MGEGYLIIVAGKGFTRSGLLDVGHELVAFSGTTCSGFDINFKGRFIEFEYYVFGSYQTKVLSFEDLGKYWK